MKRAIFLILSFIITVSLTAGCHATPKKPVVVQKDMEQMIEKATRDDELDTDRDEYETTTSAEIPEVDKKSKLVEKIGVPERYTVDDSFSNDRLTLVADAIIFLPNADKMPVMRVEPDNFSQELVNNLYDVLVGDTQMYEQQTVYTKAQIEEDILFWQQVLNDPSGELGSKSQAEYKLKGLQAYYPDSQDRIDLIPGDATIKIQTEYDFQTGQKMCDYIGVNIAEVPGFNVHKGKTFQIRNNSEDGEIVIIEDEFGTSEESGMKVIDTASQGADFYYYNYDIQPNVVWNHPLETVSVAEVSDRSEKIGDITYEDALCMTDEFFASIGIEDMQANSMTLKGILPDELSAKLKYLANSFDAQQALFGEIKGGQYDDLIEHTMIEVDCIRTVNDLPVSNGYISSYIGDPMYGKQWMYEECKITFCSKGVVSIRWESPHCVTETVADDANMLPFSEISEVFNKMYRAVFDARTVDCTRLCEVTHVTLSLRRIMEQNNIGSGIFVPAWDFYGTMEITFPGEQALADLQEGQPILTINAIDGSIIDIGRGY